MLNHITFFIKNRKVRVFILLIVTLIIGLLEMLSVALVFPVLNFSLASEGIIGETPAGMAKLLSFYGLLAEYFDTKEIIVASILLIFIAILTYLMTLFFTWVQLVFSTTLVLETKERIFYKLMSLDFDFFVSTKNSSILHVLFKSTESLSAYTESFIKALSEFIKILFFIILMFYISTIGTLLIIIIGFFYYVISRFIINKIVIPTSSEIREKEKEQIHLISEFITSVKEIRIYLQEDRWLALYIEKASQYAENLRLNQFGASVLSALPAMIIIVAVGIAGLLIQSLSLSLSFASAFATIFLAGQRVNGSISIFLSQVTAINGHSPNITSIYSLLTIPASRKNLVIASKFPKWNQLIFQNVNFSYNSSKNLILKNISFTIKKNTTVALIGDSGSGKSTFIDLLLKIYSANSGEIYFDSNPLNKISEKDFWSNVGFVGQNPVIIDGTLKDNILFGRSYSDSAIIAASKKSGVIDFLNDLDNNYNSKITENGSNLSGGQKQRLMIARALLSEPQILILDEITSALDPISENKINELIKTLHGKTTILIITHNILMTKYADDIYKLRQGNMTKMLSSELEST